MSAKIKGKSELSKLLSIKTRISDEPNFVACPSGHYRLSSSGLPRFRLIWALFRSVVPLVAVERAHGAFSVRLPASLRQPLLLASCGLFRSFVRLILPLVGSGSVHHVPEMHHFIESAQKNRCLKRSSSGYGSAGALTFRQVTRVGFSVRDGGDVHRPHDGDDVRGVLRNPRAFR